MSGTNWVRLERWAVATAFVMTLTVVLGWLGQESPALASGFAATTAYPSPTPAVPVPDSYEDVEPVGVKTSIGTLAEVSIDVGV